MRKAAGFIIFCDSQNGPRFLILRNALHGTWSFPKGHLEALEDEATGALRELEEETGIRDVTKIPGFSYVLEYDAPVRDGNGIGKKRVTLFLGRVQTEDFTLSPEHDAGGFEDADVARSQLTFKDLRRALDAARDFLGDQP